ncbi:MAG: flagellar basal body rod C-terminal domain-containing protein, partial [Ectothiorhodospira sp.]
AAAMVPTVPEGTEVESLSVVDPDDYQSWADWGGAAPGEIDFDEADFTERSEGVWRAEKNGVEIIVRGSQPADGDVRIARNEDFGVGDNRNALGLSNVQSTQYLDEGSTSLEGAYNSLVGKVGTQTRQAEVAADAQARLLEDAQAQRDSVSGVNLDEEAANLMRHQQAYQASAQVISITNTLFDTLIGAVRR